MLSLLFDGQIGVFVIIIITIVFSLTLHEFGHALSAKLLGDDTAERLGRLTLNPLPHIDPLGLLMVVCVGFGFARPVPFDARNIKQPWGTAAVAAAGPLMNLLIAVVCANLWQYGLRNGLFAGQGAAATALAYLVFINILLMLFNLIPLGALDGHYIAEWLLPPRLAYRYRQFNQQYGNLLFMALIVLSIIGVPIFYYLQVLAFALLPYITFI